MQVLLVTLHLALCSLPWLARPRCSASWPVTHRQNHHHHRSHFGSSHFGSRAISVRTGIATVSLRVQSFRFCQKMSRGNGFGDGWLPSAGRLVCLFFARVLLSPVVTSGAVSGPSFGQHPYAAMVGEMENSQFGNLVTPSLQGDLDFLYQFSDLMKESLFDAATCFSVFLAALVLVLPPCVWH